MKAVVLFSGGLDSTVVLAKALHENRSCVALSFNYGQKHKIELEHASRIAEYYKVPHKIITIDVSCYYQSTSSLVSEISPHKNRTLNEIVTGGIPNTYVPARNTLFLAYALGLAELIDAEEIHFGPNAMDRNPYPDCRPEFLHAFQNVMNLGTKQSVQGNPPQLITPLISMNKTDIVQAALELKVPIEMTWSCYAPTPKGTPCLSCDACFLRTQAIASVK